MKRESTDPRPDITLELHVSAANLPYANTYCTLQTLNKEKIWTKMGKSELITQDYNPNYEQDFIVLYRFEEIQLIKVNFYAQDENEEEFKRSSLSVTMSSSHSFKGFIGSVEFSLGSLVVCSPGMTIQLPLLWSGSKDSVVMIRAEEYAPMYKLVSDPKEEPKNLDSLVLQFKGSKLDKKDLFGLSDPFLQIFRQENGDWIKVHETEFINNTLNPEWQEFSLTIGQLCKGNVDAKIKFECNDWNRFGASELIGICQATVKDMLHNNENSPLTMELINAFKEKTKPEYSNSGWLILKSCKFVPFPPPAKPVNFLDYLKGGCKLDLMFAIDFSQRNGWITEKESLHYIDPEEKSMNDYQQVIESIGRILEPYVQHKLMPVWGFGAKWREGKGDVSASPNCFPLNLEEDYPEAKGVDEVLQLYKESLPSLIFGDKRNFTDIINAAIKFIEQKPCSQERQKYGILTIISCGVNHDYERVEEMLKIVANYPLSIIIVGIGRADFRKLKLLDGDWFSRSTTDPRDVVTFSVFKNETKHLVSEALQKIPRQLERWMSLKAVVPNSQKTAITTFESFDMSMH